MYATCDGDVRNIENHERAYIKAHDSHKVGYNTYLGAPRHEKRFWAMQRSKGVAPAWLERKQGKRNKSNTL